MRRYFSTQVVEVLVPDNRAPTDDELIAKTAAQTADAADKPKEQDVLCSKDLLSHVELFKAQAYIIQHQQDLLNNCVRRNADLVKVCNQVERENQTLRKKLKGHEDGKLWKILWAMLPTRDMIEPK